MNVSKVNIVDSAISTIFLHHFPLTGLFCYLEDSGPTIISTLHPCYLFVSFFINVNLVDRDSPTFMVSEAPWCWGRMIFVCFLVLAMKVTSSVMPGRNSSPATAGFPLRWASIGLFGMRTRFCCWFLKQCLPSVASLFLCLEIEPLVVWWSFLIFNFF